MKYTQNYRAWRTLSRPEVHFCAYWAIVYAVHDIRIEAVEIDCVGVEWNVKVSDIAKDSRNVKSVRIHEWNDPIRAYLEGVIKTEAERQQAMARFALTGQGTPPHICAYNLDTSGSWVGEVPPNIVMARTELQHNNPGLALSWMAQSDRQRWSLDEQLRNAKIGLFS